MVNETPIAAKEAAAELLRLVLAGELSPQEAQDRWPDPNMNHHDLNVALHMLEHWEADDDIRAKDAKYASWQVAELEKMISELIGKDSAESKE